MTFQTSHSRSAHRVRSHWPSSLPVDGSAQRRFGLPCRQLVISYALAMSKSCSQKSWLSLAVSLYCQQKRALEIFDCLCKFCDRYCDCYWKKILLVSHTVLPRYSISVSFGDFSIDLGQKTTEQYYPYIFGGNATGWAHFLLPCHTNNTDTLSVYVNTYIHNYINIFTHI